MAAPASDTFITLIKVSDLQPTARRELEGWRESTRPTDARLNEIVRSWYVGFQPGISASLVIEEAWPDSVLRVTLTIPPGADRSRAAKAFADGMAAAKSGKLDKAAKLFRVAVELWPFDPEYYRSRGHATLELGRLPEAEDALLGALRLQPGDWSALTMLGNVYYAKGQLELARSLHEQSLAKHETAYALTNLGGVVGKQGQIAAARTLFERALELDPTYEKARVGLAVCDAHQARGR